MQNAPTKGKRRRTADEETMEDALQQSVDAIYKI